MKTRYNTAAFILFLIFQSMHIFSASCATFQQVHKKNDQKILLLYIINDETETRRGIFGSSFYRISLYKNLIKYGHNATILVDNKRIQQELYGQNLPFTACTLKRYGMKGKPSLDDLASTIYKACKQEKITIIHCNVGDELEVLAAKRVAARLPVKIVTTLHRESLFLINNFKKTDGLISVSKRLTHEILKTNRTKRLGIKNIIWIPPFLDDEKFLSFSPSVTKEDFFKQNFTIDIKPIPIICMIATFYAQSQWKNHPLLFRAIKKLIDQHKIPVQLMLAGSGENMQKMQQVVKELGLTEYVHFLGHTTLIPELLFHSDINILTSREESFGMALAEGALMQKALIGTRGTGMEAIIQHGKTGLLFESNNVNDLVIQIARLLNDKALARQLGKNAYDYALKNFSTDANMQRLSQFYHSINNEVTT